MYLRNYMGGEYSPEALGTEVHVQFGRFTSSRQEHPADKGSIGNVIQSVIERESDIAMELDANELATRVIEAFYC